MQITYFGQPSVPVQIQSSLQSRLSNNTYPSDSFQRAPQFGTTMRRPRVESAEKRQMRETLGAGNMGDIREILIDRGLLIDSVIPGEAGQTILHLAATYGNQDTVKGLLEENGNHSINQQDFRSVRPIHLATMKNKPEVVETLIDYGANVNLTDMLGQTLLHVAARNNSLPIMQMVLAHGGAQMINHIDMQGYTPLHRAAENGNKEMLELLLAHGAGQSIGISTNPMTGTPLECLFRNRTQPSSVKRECAYLLRDTGAAATFVPNIKHCSEEQLF